MSYANFNLLPSNLCFALIYIFFHTRFTPTSSMLASKYKLSINFYSHVSRVLIKRGSTRMATISAPVQDFVSSNQRYLRSKRVIDILFTILILPFLFLVMVVVAVVIRIDSEGPIFFRQRRVRQGGVEF